MAEHRCEEWTEMGIGCPIGLLGDLLIEEEFVDAEPMVVPAHKRAKKEPPAPQQQAMMAMLMELTRQKVLDQLGQYVPAPARIPVEMVQEAYGQGARGKELGLWVAAGAASLALGLAYGAIRAPAFQTSQKH